MATCKIGYQGDAGSNAEAAARLFAEEQNLCSVEFVPLVSSRRVVDACLSGTCTHGVMAIENNLGGTVLETRDALAGAAMERVWEDELEIHHCLFCLQAMSETELNTVASHIQALIQTRETRAVLFPELAEMEIADTAIGARWLASGELPRTTSVICREETGLSFELSLLAKDIEDRPSTTLFAGFVVS